jgi:hypothetical protein
MYTEDDADDLTCSCDCPPPDLGTVPVLTRLASWTITWVTWPWYVRKLKRMGFKRQGWMTWGS